MRLGFAAGAGARAAAAATFAMAVVVAMLAVERLPSGPRSAPVALSVAATAPVARWTVLADGAEVTAASADPSSWSGSVPIGAMEVTVRAEGESAATIALKLSAMRLGTELRELAWGEGSASCTLKLRAGDHHD